MNNSYLIILISAGGVFIFGLVVAIIKSLRNKARRAALEQIAQRIGLDFAEKVTGELFEAFHKFSLFGRQTLRRKSRNIMRGHYQGSEMVIVDYSYKAGKSGVAGMQGSGWAGRTHHQTVVAIHLGRTELPRFELRPEQLFLKIGQVFGLKDFDFDNYPEFSKQYQLQGEDEANVRTLFESRAVKYFQVESGWSVEGSGEWLLIYRFRKLTDPEQLQSFLSKVIMIRDLFS